MNNLKSEQHVLQSTKRKIESLNIFKISIVFVLFAFLYVFYTYSCSIKTQSENCRYSISSMNFGALVLDNKSGDVYEIDGTLISKFKKKQ